MLKCLGPFRFPGSIAYVVRNRNQWRSEGRSENGNQLGTGDRLYIAQFLREFALQYLRSYEVSLAYRYGRRSRKRTFTTTQARTRDSQWQRFPPSASHEGSPFGARTSPCRSATLSVTRQLAVFEITLVRRAVLLPVLHQTQSRRESLEAWILSERAHLRCP